MLVSTIIFLILRGRINLSHQYIFFNKTFLQTNHLENYLLYSCDVNIPIEDLHPTAVGCVRMFNINNQFFQTNGFKLNTGIVLRACYLL